MSTDDNIVIPLQYAIGSSWRRLAARVLDLMVYYLIAFIFAIVFSGLSLIFNLPGLVVLCLAFICVGICWFMWIYIEAFFLSRFDTTPGKYLMSLCVRNARQEKLTFKQAASRAAYVLIEGLWLNFHPLSFIPMFLAYRKVKQWEPTSWDKRGKFTVEYHPLSRVKVSIALILLFLLSLFTVGLYLL